MHFKETPGQVTLQIGRETIGTCSGVSVDQGPGRGTGKELLAHELTHIVQQKAGQPVTLRLKGLDPRAAARIVPSQVKVLILSMTDSTGRKHAIGGKLKSATPKTTAAAPEWEITYEALQRTL